MGHVKGMNGCQTALATVRSGYGLLWNEWTQSSRLVSIYPKPLGLDETGYIDVKKMYIYSGYFVSSKPPAALDIRRSLHRSMPWMTVTRTQDIFRLGGILQAMNRSCDTRASL
jgi:hypothetical protein